MWFRIGLKGTDHNRYVKLNSEDRNKLIQYWLELAHWELDDIFIDEMMDEAKRKMTYPKLCEIELIEKPPRKYAEFMVAKFNRQIEELACQRNLFQQALA